MEFFFELLKLTLPALIVFVTVYFLQKQHSETELALRNAELQKTRTDKISAVTLPLQMNAYERLSLFCERISLPNLLMRLPVKEQTAAGLRVGMMMAVQQEYEHNLTQQIYVSDQLWQIVNLAKEDLLTVITGLYEKVPPGADAEAFTAIINSYLATQEGISPLQTAQIAVRKEAGVLLNRRS